MGELIWLLFELVLQVIALLPFGGGRDGRR